MKASREQIENRLRQDAGAWRKVVAARSGVATPEPARRRRWPLALAAAVLLSAAMLPALLPQRDAPPPATVRIVMPQITLPTIPAARARSLPTANAMLLPAASGIEASYEMESQRLAADARRVLDFLMAAVPSPLPRSATGS